MAYTRCGIALPKTHTATKIDVAKTPLATFQSNVSGLYIPEILAYITATQEGTGDPSPINPRAINGVTQIDTTRTGVNLCGGDYLADLIVATFPNAVKNEVNKTVSYMAPYANARKLFDKFKPNTVYTFFVDTASANTNIAVQYTDGTSMRLYTGVNVTSSSKSVDYLRGQNQSGTTVLNYEKCGVMEGALTTSDFVAYTGTTVTTNLGDTYYGGYVNVPTGLLTVTDIAPIYDGTEDWQENTTGIYYIGVTDAYELNSCNIFDVISRGSSGSLEDLQCRINIARTNVNFKNTAITSLADWKTFVSNNNIQLCYKLATPQTVQLTPAQIEQLLGQNNVFCSSGDVAVKGWKID